MSKEFNRIAEKEFAVCMPALGLVHGQPVGPISIAPFGQVPWRS